MQAQLIMQIINAVPSYDATVTIPSTPSNGIICYIYNQSCIDTNGESVTVTEKPVMH